MTDKELYDQYLYEKFQQEKAQVKAEPEREIIQEMPEDISFYDRFVAKNLAQNKEKQINYLQQKYPEREFALDKGQVITRPRGASGAFQVLDPEGFDIQDITDVLTDVGAGVAEAAATAAGAVGGAALGGGIGALPGAAAAGGAAGAGLEALRQYAGKMAGIPQDVSGSDVAISGAFGAASPFLFGSGAAAKKITEAGAKSVLKEATEQTARRLSELGAGKQQIQDIAEKLAKKGAEMFGQSGQLGAEIAEKGIAGAGLQRGTAKLGKLFTGVEDDVFERAVKNTDQIKMIDEVGEDIAANQQFHALEEAITNQRMSVGQQINEYVRNSGEFIDLKPVKDRIFKAINKLESKGSLKDIEIQKLKALREMRDKAFGTFDESTGEFLGYLPDKVDAADAFEIKETLTSMADFASDKFRPDKKSSDKAIATIASNAYGDVTNAISSKIQKAPELNQKFKQVLKDADYLRNNARNKKSVAGYMDEDAFDTKGYNLLKKVGYGRDDKNLRKLTELDARYGTNTSELSKDLAAHNLVENAGWVARSGEGATSTSRTLQGQVIGGGLGAFIGSQMNAEGGRPLGGVAGLALGGLLTSPRAFMNYMKASGLAQQAAQKSQLTNPYVRKSVYNMMRND